MFLVSFCSCICPDPLKPAWCWAENEDVVGAAPTDDAPNASECSTSLLPSKVRLISEVWLYLEYFVRSVQPNWKFGTSKFCTLALDFLILPVPVLQICDRRNNSIRFRLRDQPYGHGHNVTKEVQINCYSMAVELIFFSKIGLSCLDDDYESYCAAYIHEYWCMLVCFKNQTHDPFVFIKWDSWWYILCIAYSIV